METGHPTTPCDNSQSLLTIGKVMRAELSQPMDGGWEVDGFKERREVKCWRPQRAWPECKRDMGKHLASCHPATNSSL